MPTPYISQNEALLIVSCWPDGERIIEEQTLGQTFESVENALSHVLNFDYAERVFRLDTADWAAPEDITLELYEQWFRTVDREEYTGHGLPPFIVNNRSLRDDLELSEAA